MGREGDSGDEESEWKLEKANELLVPTTMPDVA